ncbi:MAG: hypothetical protein GY719_42435 [bacterium]|nr:hypothetical protein [bacterium]
MSHKKLAELIGGAQARAVQEALKPLLRKAGVHTVEARIGKPRRFLSNTRQRGTMKVRDFLAVCAVLEIDPGDFLTSAVGGEVAPEIRRPRIVASAWKRIEERDGPGLGERRLRILETQTHERPQQARSALSRELQLARPDELPRILGLYGSALRVESDLDRAELVLKEARDLARELGLRDAEADLLIRMAYLTLERERLPRAVKWAQEGTLAHTRLGDREGQGRGFQILAILGYYSGDFEDALRNSDAALGFLSDPLFRLATHQLAALCHAEAGAVEDARQAASLARAAVDRIPTWMTGKLSWLEARLTQGATRLDHLKNAKHALCPARPPDCALVTIELIEEALSFGEEDLASSEVTGLCALLDRTGSARIEKAIIRLVRHQTRLNSRLVAQIRRSLDRARDRRLSTLVSADLQR